MKLMCPVPGPRAKGFVKRNDLTPPALAVIQRTSGNESAEHLFQAQGLSTKLHRIRHFALATASFVFDRKGNPALLGAGERDDSLIMALRRMKLDDVGHAEEAQLAGAQP